MTRVPAARRGAARGAAGRAAARTPFVVLIVTLLAGGLISLLLLNSAVNQDSFELDKLRKQTADFTDQQQQLQQEIDGYSAPGGLAERARRLGMVPGGDPAFLGPDGAVHGSPQPATAPPPPPSPSPSPSATPSTLPGASATAAVPPLALGGPAAPTPRTGALAPPPTPEQVTP